jgi:hypothetical protein
MALIETVEPVRLRELEKGIRVPAEIWEIWMQVWDWTFHQLTRKEYPAPFRQLDEFQLACICADPVLWARCFLREPEDPDHKDPYSLWWYQEESLRFNGHTLHKCAAEVGKTREIVAYTLHKAFTVRNGSGLIGAPQQTHLDEIIEASTEQLEFNEDLAPSLIRHKKHPHHAFYWSNRFKTHFRPSGYDGEAYRGVHVRTFAIKDEAAKDKNKKQWSEFWRAMKPGCAAKIYSVTDGDRSCDFYRLGQKALRPQSQMGGVDERKDAASGAVPNLVRSLFEIQRRKILGDRISILPTFEKIYGEPAKAEEDKQSCHPGLSGIEQDDGKIPGLAGMTDEKEPDAVDVKAPESMKGMSAHIQNIKFTLYQWPKRLMPDPYWSPQRKEFYVDLYGGEDSPEYKHNVLGEDGDPEYSVFPWEQFKHIVKEIPEYRCLKVLVDSGNNEVIVKGYRIEVVPGDNGPVPRMIMLLDEVFRKTGFFDYSLLPEGGMSDSDFRKTIKSFFSSAPGLKRGGADFGFTGDPTEIVIKNIIGERKRLIARLAMRHVTYDQQCQALDALDDVFGPQEAISWGTDFGNAGSAVAHDLQGLPQYEHKHYDNRLRGFMFEGTSDNIDEHGNPVLDSKDGKPVKITLKELATDHLTKRMQRMTTEYPADPDIISDYPNHTVSNAGKHRIYKKKDDHIIDADRAETLAEILGVGIGFDGFSGGVGYR